MARLPVKTQARFDRLKRMERGSGSVLLSSVTYEKAAQEATDGQFEFLCSLLQSEYDLRAANKIARLRRQAGFPFTKDFGDFSWEGVEFPADFSREELLSCGFVDRKRVAFKETSKLILELNAAHQEGRLKQKLDALEKCDLVIRFSWKSTGFAPRMRYSR